MPQLNVRIPQAIYDALEAVCAQGGYTKTQAVIVAIERLHAEHFSAERKEKLHRLAQWVRATLWQDAEAIAFCEQQGIPLTGTFEHDVLSRLSEPEIVSLLRFADTLKPAAKENPDA